MGLPLFHFGGFFWWWAVMHWVGFCSVCSFGVNVDLIMGIFGFARCLSAQRRSEEVSSHIVLINMSRYIALVNCETLNGCVAQYLVNAVIASIQLQYIVVYC
eukprot:TRINITY_DN2040_c0_g2_i2.p1 TRINITY_DN2040_c0_g2~~TRINITY_DN2040_c0_g2_i2.p1  ORF type:complete len:102 (-),score=6.92 TRINITY_DN2040_c0_g2_i2:23-328(-)